MRFVYILEDDSRFAQQITEALLIIDPLVQVRQFRKLEEFANWIKFLMKEGPTAVVRGGLAPEGFNFAEVGNPADCVLQLVISKVEFLGARQIGLMKKTRELFIKQKICTQEDPTAFVLTAFEDPAFHIQDLRDRILSNILMKPFDKLILQQHLTFALDGRHPPSKHAVAPYKTSAVIEVLKTVEMDTLSTVGFRSRSNREIPAGSVSKYYGKIFISERQKSAIAKVIDCVPHPEIANEFHLTVSFFGLDATQISNIRRYVIENRTKVVKSPLTIHSSKKQQSVGIVFVEERDDIYQSLAPTILRKIKGAKIIRYKNLKELLTELDPKLDGSAATKPFAPGPSIESEIDLHARLQNFTTTGVTFCGQVLTNQHLLTNFIRESERAEFLKWLINPFGDFISSWGFGEQSFVIKVEQVKDRLFRIQEASNFEKDDYRKQKSQLAAGTDFIFVSHRFAGVDRKDLWIEILKRLPVGSSKTPAKAMIVSTMPFTDAEERSLAQVFDDLYFAPVERVYVLQKMILMNSHLEILEDPIDPYSIAYSEAIKSARPAPIEELSEAGLLMKYDRQVSLGSFREFVLWQPYEIGAPEITATCNFAEPGAASGEWKLTFVFFAMKDTLLKAIRNWIRENYILSKDKS